MTTSSERQITVSTFDETVTRACAGLRDAKTALEDMSESNIRFRDQYGDVKTSEWSFRVAAINCHTKRLRRIFTRIASAQSIFDKEAQRREAVHGTPEASDDTLNCNNKMGKVFPMASEEEIRVKQEDMRMVERKIREIRNAFLQIAMLVESQGEMMDCIEFSVVNSKNYSHEANVQLIKARRKQRRATWFKFCCFAFLFMLLVGLGIGLWKIIEYYKNKAMAT